MTIRVWLQTEHHIRKKDKSDKIYTLYSSYFYNFIETLISNHPDIRLCIITAEKKEFHCNSQQFLKFWRISELYMKKRKKRKR